MAISPGDLVMIVHSCCDALASDPTRTVRPGCVRTVDRLRVESVRCPHCGWRGTVSLAYLVPDSYAPAAWLKRIDPLSEPSSTEHVDEVTA